MEPESYPGTEATVKRNTQPSSSTDIVVLEVYFDQVCGEINELDASISYKCSSPVDLTSFARSSQF